MRDAPRRDAATMRIFVGGLPRTATKDDVVQLFRPFGAADDDVVLPRDRRTRRRKGFAYVELADATAVQAAIAHFADYAFDGKPLTVCAAANRPLKRPRRMFTIVIAALAGSCHVSSADAGQTSAGIALTLNPILGGWHESYNDRRHIPPVPVPLLEVRAAAGPFELQLEGLPPFASIRSSDAREGRTSTQLSIATGTLRLWDPRGRYSVGVGDVLYNQSTHYLDPIELPGTGETQFSRLSGSDYAAGYREAWRRGRFDASLAYAPALHGTQFTIYNDARDRPRIDPERAKQIDAAVRYTRTVGRTGEIIVGLRYINYTAEYAERNGGLSDRNVGLLPVLGYRMVFGTK